MMPLGTVGTFGYCVPLANLVCLAAHFCFMCLAAHTTTGFGLAVGVAQTSGT